MFFLLSPLKIISIIAGVYGVIWLLINQTWPSRDVGSAFRLADGLEFVLFLFSAWGWRKIWALIPALNKWLFPDLNGSWDAKITWVHEGNTGTVEGTAHIVQDFFKIAIEVTTSSSDSSTLAVVAKRDSESGRPFLYYVYGVRPKVTAQYSSAPYEGAAMLSVKHENYAQLEGNYFTSRATTGHFRFVRR